MNVPRIRPSWAGFSAFVSAWLFMFCPTVGAEVHVTPQGVRFEDSCIRLIPKWDDFARRSLDAVIQSSYDHIDSCGKRYPELEPYLTEWKKHARIAQIRCNAQSGDERYSAGSNGRDGIFLPKKTLLNWAKGFKDPHSESSPVEPPLNSIIGFIHEVFHSTGANNRIDHNQVELIKPVANRTNRGLVQPQGCKEDIASDRVNFVTSICTQAEFDTSSEDARLSIFDRISGCGLKRGCEEVFTSQLKDQAEDMSTWITARSVQSFRLPQVQAHSLCQKIHGDGYCRAVLDQNPNAALEAVPAVRKMRLKLFQRFRELLPRDVNEIPQAMIDSVPGIREKLDGVVEDPCFQAIFKKEKSGSYYPERVFFGKDEVRAEPIKNPVNEFISTAALFDHFRRLTLSAQSELSKIPGCNGEKKNRNILEPWLELADNSYQLGKEWEWKAPLEFALGHYDRGQLEETKYISQTAKEARARLRHFIGEALFDEYEAVSRRFNPKSPDFDCEGAGLNLYRTADRVSRELELPHRSSSKSTFRTCSQ